MSISIKNYYKQILFIANSTSTTQISDTFDAVEKNMIGDGCSTFELIDSLIRDLVSIKNKIKERRDQTLLKVEPTFNDTAGENDTIKVEGTDGTDKVKKADTTYSIAFSARGIVDGEKSTQPTMYINDNGTPANLSESVTFSIIRRAAYIIKTLRRATTAQIKTAFTTNNGGALGVLNVGSE